MSADRPPVPLKVQLAVYAAGMFSNTITNVLAVVLGLWVIALEPSPTMFGIIIGSRHLLPLLFAIHGGSLMDRLGTRRVMIACAVMTAVVPFLYPMAPWVAAVVALQMVIGLGISMGWIGAQACIGQLMHGNAVYAGRFAFTLRIGMFCGPPLGGLGYDLGGPFGGFAVVGLWGIGILVSSLLLPVPESPTEDEQRPVRAKDLVPRPSDYINAFKLMAVPGMALVIVVTMLRIAGNGIQESFYVVYLDGIGLTATEIGLLVSAASILGGAGALGVGWIVRYVSKFWLLVVAVIGALTMVMVTPLLTSFYVLALTSALRGGGMGLSQPLLISILSESVGRDVQARGVALRITANRLASATTPVIMGAVVDVVGLQAGFFVVCGALIAGMLLVALYVKRTSAFRTT